jgi:hypothetical protein
MHKVEIGEVGNESGIRTEDTECGDIKEAEKE